jgi:hypothetical protein
LATLTLLALALALAPAYGQLAITEVMSDSFTGGRDFWELSNYSDAPIYLDGYRFKDADLGFDYADGTPFAGLVIAGGQSIVFVQRAGTVSAPDTLAAFRALWRLDPSVPVVTYSANGLAMSGDKVRVWALGPASDEDIVDEVAFGQAATGRSFNYNPSTGLFDLLSTSGVNGAFSSTNNDAGSPGVKPPRRPVGFNPPPSNVVANAGDTVTLSFGRLGLPPPTVQWFFNDSPIPGARRAALTLTDVQVENVGPYHVVLSNYFEVVTSTNVTLTINPQLTAPRFVLAPVDQIVFEGQTVTFHALATGVPQPTYQWFRNGAILSGETQNTYIIGFAQLSDTAQYSVTASNSQGSVTTNAQLRVTRRPDLRITEVMTSRSPNLTAAARDDWWELTNFETDPANSVDLYGYVFDEDNDGHGGRINTGWTNRQHVIIRPGESLIFVEGLTPAQFRDWWGPANLPVDLQIITYSGGGLGLNETNDVVFLWNPGATTDGDWLVAAPWFIPNAPPGRSFTFDPDIQFDPNFFECCNLVSVLDVNGAVAAVNGGDIGSPGYISAPLEPRIRGVNWETGGCRLTWRSVPGRSYSVRYKNSLADVNWIPLTPLPLPSWGTTGSYLDRDGITAGQRFYRVFLLDP